MKWSDIVVLILRIRMKTRKRFIRVVIAVVIILLLVRFVGIWRYDVASVPFVDIDSIAVSFENDLVCYILSAYTDLILSSLCNMYGIALS